MIQGSMNSSWLKEFLEVVSRLRRNAYADYKVGCFIRSCLRRIHLPPWSSFSRFAVRQSLRHVPFLQIFSCEPRPLLRACTPPFITGISAVIAHRLRITRCTSASQSLAVNFFYQVGELITPAARARAASSRPRPTRSPAT